MAERYANRFASGLRLQVLPFPLKMPTLDLYLYWHASADGDAASRWLRGLVVDSFKDTR
jgi:DNA-binding transcriptional LysR family regulator